ncbi:hypothetical protein [Promicromonospora sp. NPDC050262]|uniref:hypothetical protein n=1 Tax=Promicromonospora sp. NPDC050262 TaxID=3155036 RepID=UPI0033FB6ABE
MTATTPDLHTTEPSDLDPESVFWEARPELAAVRQTARAAMASPWAVLGCVLARVSLSVPPSVVIPPLGNDRSAVASLNVFVGLVGPSGTGKGVATAAAEDFLNTPPGGGRLIEKLPLGSGEGISHTLIETDSEGEVTPSIRSVWFDVPEIDTLTALIGRQASTTSSELRKMFSGEGLGFQNSDATRRKIVPAHSYRAALVAGVQPLKAGPLLDDAAGGTPQRFLWLPATDPGAPDVTPDAPAPLSWSSPVLATEHRRTLLTVAASITAVLREERLNRLREVITDGLGQQSLVRLKVAALLALLARRLDVTEGDWSLADYIMRMSDHTRNRMRDVLRAEAMQAVQARAEARAAFDEHHDAAAAQRTAAKILSKLDNEPVSATTVRRALGPALRDYFEAATDDLIRRGLVERNDDVYHGQPRTRLRRRQ